MVPAVISIAAPATDGEQVEAGRCPTIRIGDGGPIIVYPDSQANLGAWHSGKALLHFVTVPSATAEGGVHRARRVICSCLPALV